MQRRQFGGREREREHGQIIVVFALSVVAIMVSMALLFDGAQALLLKRQLQNAADSAALAGANLLQASNIGCSTNLSTTPRSTISDAAKASVTANLGWTGTKLTSGVTVTCATGYDNNAVSVSLTDSAKTLFGGVARTKNIAVSVSSVAFNGPVGSGKFSIMELNPGPPTTSSWSNTYKGCPSAQFAGSAKMAFQGSVQVDSACLSASGGAFNVNGNSSVICFGTLNFTTDVCTTNGTFLRMVGTWSQGPNVVTPSPIQNSAYVPDPLASLHAISTTGWTTFGAGSGTTIGNGNNAQCAILTPGYYQNGISIKAQGSAYLLPGIYVIGGSGLSFNGQGAIYTIKQSLSSSNCSTFTPDTTWDTGTASTSMCPEGSCGVLIYNTTGTGSGAGATMGSVALTGGSGVKMRAFVPSLAPTIQWTSNGGTCTGSTGSTCTGGWLSNYRNMVLWQDRSPTPSSSYHQPDISLLGGGNAIVTGTIYAPSAKVSLGGNCGGNAGVQLDLTLQFITWDLEITGSCYYNFLYDIDKFVQFPAYGLVE